MTRSLPSSRPSVGSNAYTFSERFAGGPNLVEGAYRSGRLVVFAARVFATLTLPSLDRGHCIHARCAGRLPASRGSADRVGRYADNHEISTLWRVSSVQTCAAVTGRAAFERPGVGTKSSLSRRSSPKSRGLFRAPRQSCRTSNNHATSEGGL